MPLWVAAIIGGLVQAAGTLVGRVLVSLGIGFTVYSGVSASIGWAKTQVLQNISAAGAVVVQVMGLAQIGTAISILFSALTARMILQGLQPDGTLRRMVQK